MEIERRTSDYAEIELKDNIVYVSYKDLSIITLDEAKIVAKDTIEICKGDPKGIIINGTGISLQMNSDARNYFATNQDYINTGKAIAIVITNTASMLLAKFYIKYHKPVRPTKIFSKLTDAEEWLKTNYA